MSFAHQSLDAFHTAMDLAVGVEKMAAEFPEGHADTKDQVRRAASATMRNIAEAANRWTPRDKAARFRVAHGECAECDAILEMIARLGLRPEDEIARLRRYAARVGSMLVALIRFHQGRAS